MALINTKLLRKLRREKGLTQADLAERVDIGQSYICKFEKGVAEPSLSTLAKIAKVLNTDIKELLK